MKTNEALELRNKIEELKDEYKQYKESAEDGVEKRSKLARIQLEIGRNVKKISFVVERRRVYDFRDSY